LSAGVTVSTGANNTVGTIPFTATSTRMTVRVYSPRAGIPVRLKVEDAADPTRSVETEALTTKVNTWETLTFDFANQVAGTAALNLAYTYNRLSIFFDYGKTGAAGGSGTFYFDDVLFDTSGGSSSFKPITFALACGQTLTVDGAGPAGPLVLGDDGLFYGTTSAGGPDGCGAVFRIGFDGTGFQVLRQFSAATADATTGLPENADGATPIGGLIDGGDGVFYGTATQGGSEGRGVVYSITPAGVFNVLHVFNNANGSRPLAELLLGTDGKLYGTTNAGGANSEGTTTSFGTIFSIGRDGTGFTRLYSFDGSQGSGPGSKLLQLSSGVFVGLTNSSGSCGYGTLFRYSQAGDTVDGNRRCGRSDNNNNGGGTAGLGLLALLGALALGRRRRHG
jgi:MYXO-CTERM domain-containing protein